MKRAFVIAFAAACGPSAPAPAAPHVAQRACEHAAEPVPASCVDRAIRGRLLKDDHDAGLRLWQACDAGGVVDGAYVGERVGNGRLDDAALTSLYDAHHADVWKLGVIDASVAACAPGGASACIRLDFQDPREDVPAVAADLTRVIAPDADVCLPFRIAAGVSTGAPN